MKQDLKAVKDGGALATDQPAADDADPDPWHGMVSQAAAQSRRRYANARGIPVSSASAASYSKLIQPA